ncbi:MULTISPECIES: ABC transporter substrate-binding protein [Vibrio]|uniref:ABC transporter substrate-binding protein n=1 Tax=Vibrio TaxID=662 RepID=UPI000E49F8C3|nr:ABC transporter substrate-binding protein [Vibrio sp. dhg]AXT72890.1 ABC transporter substrate-binding protein [Vibrio sp. dhg]
MKKFVRNAIALSLMALPMVAISADKPNFGNVRVVIGSKSTGGDTYQAAAIVSEELAKKLDANIKVDAVGSSAAFSTLKRVRNGSTIMIFHDQSYLGNLYGTRGYYDIFDEYIIGPTFATNPANAYLLPKKSPYNTLEEVIDAAGSGETIRVAIQPGGVSEIGYSAVKNAIKLKYPGQEKNLVAVNTGSQADKNQQLFDGLADMIQGSLPANEQFTRLPESDQKAMKFVWLTSTKDTIAKVNTNGFGELSQDQIYSYAEPNVVVPMDATTNFTFDKEFFFLYNKNMSKEKIAYIDKALKEIYDEGKIQKIFEKAFFVPNYRNSEDALKHLQEKNDKYKEVLDNITD